MEALCLWKNLCSWTNQKRKKVLGKKRQKQKQTKTKTGEKKKERVLFCQERKKILCESDWYWQSSTLASRFRTKKSPSNQNLPHLMSNTRFPFLYASTSLDTKTLTTTSNRNFGSCMSVRCLAPQNMFRFFHFCCGLFFAFGNFAHYCVVRLNALLSNRDKKKNFSSIGLGTDHYFSGGEGSMRNIEKSCLHGVKR